MPISVSCSCGKIFKVADAMAGQNVQCQVCNASVFVEAVTTEPAVVAASVEPAPSIARIEPEPALGDATKECYFCSEIIPVDATVCPTCDESLLGVQDLSPDQISDRIADIKADLAEYNSDPANAEADRRLAGRAISGMSITMGVFVLFGLVMILCGALSSDPNAEGALLGFGIFIIILFGLIFLVTFSGDRGTRYLVASDTPEKELKRYLSGLARRALQARLRTSGAVCPEPGLGAHGEVRESSCHQR